MTETKFAPGPWVTGERTNGYRKIDTYGSQHADPHYGLAKVVVEIDGEPYKRGEANAALIAAAPDLYEALADIMGNEKFHTMIGGNPIAVEALMTRAYAALAKARGET